MENKGSRHPLLPEGLPITLSVLYIEIARRLKLNVVGVSLPGHFVVRHEPPGGPRQIIDVFDGKLMSREEAEKKVKQITGQAAKESDFEPVTKKAIIVRMLHNLINVARSEKGGDSMLCYLDGILVIDRDAHQERWLRTIFRYQAGLRSVALPDRELLLKHAPPEVDLDVVRDLRRLLQKKN
jgi:serine protease Do